MSLSPGSRLGPYEITGPLGAGGMGEVYRARDTRLGREVAVKVLPADAAADAALRDRFEREARVVSSLNHRNICTLHDVGRDGTTDFLVMELLEGETLAKRLERGPLPLAEALRVGAEVAAALDAAHRAGVVHRDLKPGNVMLTRGGAKVLDFGIAKLTEVAGGAAPPGSFPTALPTRTTPLTAKGTLVGTLNYMAPEQLEGRAVDHRSDLFAFGAVLYEMLTGRRAFDGASQASVIAAILERHPAAPATLAADVPRALDRLVRDCLAKDPEERRQSAHDVGSQLRALAEAPADTPSRIRAIGTRRALLPWVIAAAVVVLAAVFAGLAWRRGEPEPRLLEAAVVLRPQSDPVTPAVSPDGSAIAYANPPAAGRASELWVRRLDDAVPKRLEGTAGARRPFWSADGGEIAFFGGEKLMAVSASGGPPRVVCDASYGAGGFWAADGTIVFATAFNEGLKRVDASGGSPATLTTLDAARHESGHVWPMLLPGGRSFLFLSRTTASETSRIEMAPLSGGPRRVVSEADALVGFSPPWLLFVRNGVMYAQRFDPGSGAVSGEKRAVVSDVHYDESWSAASAGVAGDTLCWTPHRPRKMVAEWYDSKGRLLGSAFEEQDVRTVALSPDASRLLYSAFDPLRGANDLWIRDLARGSRSRLTRTDSDEDVGPWLPGGSEVLFSGDARGPYGIYRMAADGTGEARLVLEEPHNDWWPTSVTPDGRKVFARRDGGKGTTAVWAFPLDSPGERALWLEEANQVELARVSPDGRLVAYESFRAGPGAVWVRRADGGAAVQVSSASGFSARWDPEGKSIRYVGGDGHLRRVPVREENGRIVPGTEDHDAEIRVEGVVDFDVARDGRVLVVRDEADVPLELRIRTGWRSRLR